MKIIVLVKQVPDTWGDRTLNTSTGQLERGASDPVIDEINERALEVALTFKDSNDAEVIALSMGPSSATDVLRKSLSMGADSAIHVLDDGLSNADLSRTSAVLAAAIAKTGFDVVIAGNEATDGRGGVIPTMIAEHLKVPSATNLDSTVLSDGSVSGVRSDEYGSVTLHAPLPAVISVSEASAEARFPNFKGIMKAKKKPLAVWSLADLDLAGASIATTVTEVTERPARAAGKKVVDDGNAGNELADFLAAGRLI